jgi:NAD(P)H-nitrite reductase large subunit
VVLDDGSRVPYDKLLIATGSNPFVPPMKGLETVEKKFSFMSLDDAKALQAALTEGSRVLIIGAGLIGLKCAEGIFKKVGHITVVDLADRFCPASSTRRLRLSCMRISRSRGSIFFGGQLAEFSPGSALLKSGKKVDFDLLVIAVGVRPNTGLAARRERRSREES